VPPPKILTEIYTPYQNW